MNGEKRAKIALIIASRGFRDCEYFIPKEIFRQEGFEVETVSDKAGSAIGSDGGEADAAKSLENIKPEEYDAVVFIGGQGAMACLDNENSYALARKTVSLGKILAAICIAPSILAKAGVLDKKRATVWSSPMDKSQFKVLSSFGALRDDSDVVADGGIVTASGPDQAQAFARKIAALLKDCVQ